MIIVIIIFFHVAKKYFQQVGEASYKAQNCIDLNSIDANLCFYNFAEDKCYNGQFMDELATLLRNFNSGDERHVIDGAGHTFNPPYLGFRFESKFKRERASIFFDQKGLKVNMWFGDTWNF